MALQLAGCIIIKDGRLLLLHRNTARRSQWEIPGGKVEADETPAQAAVREAREELGIEVELEALLGSASFRETGKTLHYFWFAATIIDGTPSILEHETFDDLRYMSRREMDMHHQELSANLRNFLNLGGDPLHPSQTGA